jgi:hypothetical protein
VASAACRAACGADELAEAKARIAELERVIGRQQADLHFFREALRLWDATSREGVATLSDGMRVLLARVRSAPEDGKANEALCKLIADKLGVAASKARLVAGAKSRLKQVAVTGEPPALLAKLNAL